MTTKSKVDMDLDVFRLAKLKEELVKKYQHFKTAGRLVMSSLIGKEGGRNELGFK